MGLNKIVMIIVKGEQACVVTEEGRLVGIEESKKETATNEIIEKA